MWFHLELYDVRGGKTWGIQIHLVSSCDIKVAYKIDYIHSESYSKARG